MTNEERKIQAALGTTPYFINKVKCSGLVDIISRYLLFPDEHMIHQAALIGFIIGGLCVAVTRADIDQIIKKASKFFDEKYIKKYDAEINWAGLRKEINLLVKFEQDN